MTLREQERRQRQHTASLPPAVQRAASVVPRPRKPYRRKTLTPEERERRKREREEERRRLQSEALKRGRIVVYPWTEWCAMRGVSVPTGNRLEKAGKVKVTYLSDRRKGVRSDHDQEYLDSCVRDGA